MTGNIRIAPSILSADFARLGEQVQQVASGGADLIHIDVMDGRFVPNITFGPLVVGAVRRSTALPIDVHLMIVEPEHLLRDFADAGANSMTVHVEVCPHLHRTLQTIHALGCRAGVAINPHTPPSMLTEVIHFVDVVNVMTVNPGFGGQMFLPETLPKIRQLRAMIQDSKREIALEVDGGIDLQTAQQAVEAGADVLIAGSAIFNDQHSVTKAIEGLRTAVRK